MTQGGTVEDGLDAAALPGVSVGPVGRSLQDQSQCWGCVGFLVGAQKLSQPQRGTEQSFLGEQRHVLGRESLES